MFLGQQESSAAELLAEAALHEQFGRKDRARECLVLATSADETPRARFEWALFLSRAGEDAGAVCEWNRLWESVTGTGWSSLASAIAANLSSLFRRRGELSQSAHWHQRSLRAAVECARDGSAGVPRRFWLDCAEEALSAGRWNDARSLLRAVLRAAEANSDLAVEADAWGLCGVLAMRRGRRAEALRALRTAVQRHRCVGDDAAVAVDALNLASLAISSGRPRAALSAARLAFQHGLRCDEFDLTAQAERLCATLRRAIARLRLSPARN